MIKKDKPSPKKARSAKKINCSPNDPAGKTVPESGNRLSGIIEHTQAGYFFIDVDGFFRQVNPAWLRLHGYDSPEEVIGRHFSLTQVDTDQEAAKQNVKALLSGNSIPTGEFTHRCKDGSTGYHTFSASPVILDGKVVGLEGFIIDTTEHKRTEFQKEAALEALRESEKKYRAIFDNSPLGIFRSTPEGRFIEVNPALAKMLGYDSPETVLQKIHNIGEQIYVKSDHRQTIVNQQLLIPIPGMTKHYNLYRRADGSEFNAILYLNAVRDKDGQTLYLEGIVDDITERRQAETALMKSEEKFAKAFKASTASITIASMEDGRYLDVNDVFLKKTGFAKEEVIGHTSTELNVWIDMKDRQRFLEELSANGFLQDFEIQYRMRDGEVLDFSVSSEIIDLDGKPCSLNYILDITHRKQAELQLKEAERKFRTIADYTHDWENWVGSDGKLIWISPSVERITGFSVPECMIMPNFPFPMIHPDDHGMILAKMQEAERRSLNDIEFRILRKDKTIRWGSASTNPVLTEDGGTAGHRSSIRDITDRRLAQEALRTSNEQLSMALEVGNAGIWKWNLKSNNLHLDDRFHRMLGYAPGELPETLQAWLTYHHPEDIPVWMPRAQAYLRGESLIYESEHRIRTKAGAWDWIFTRGKLVSPEQFIGIAMNVTERKQAEEKLRESEEKFRYLVEDINDVIYALDKEGRYTYVSPAVQSVFGYSPEEFMQRPLGELVHPDDKPLLIEGFHNVLAGIRKPNEYRIFNKSGEMRWIRSSSKPVMTNGMLTGIKGTATDITEQKLAQEALRESEETYRMLYESINDGLFTAELNADGTLSKFILVNDIACRLLGYTREELLTKTPFDINSDQAKKTLAARIQRILKEKHVTIETEHVAKDGRLIPIELTTNVTHFRNRIILHSIARDISERKQAEKVLGESEKKYRLIAESMSDNIWLMDLNLNTFFISPSVTKTRGYNLDEIRELPISAHLTPESLERVLALAQKELTEDHLKDRDHPIELSLELEFIRKDGTTLWTHVRVKLVRDDMGAPLHLLCVSRNITERKHVEEALRESEQTHRALVEALPDTIMRFDHNGRHLFVSENVQDATGIPSDTFIGKTHRELGFPESQCNFWEESIRKVFESGLAFETEFSFDGPHGAVIFNWRLIPELDAQWQVRTVLTISRDITAHRKTEMAIRDSEEKFSRAFEKSPMLMMISSIEDGTILDANEAFFSLSGFKREEVIGKTAVELGWIKPEDRDRIIHEVKQKGYVEELELEATSKDKTKMSCLFYGEVISIGGRQQMLGLAQDVTERKQIEDTQAFLAQANFGADDQPFFEALAGYLAEKLDMDFVCIDRLEGDGLNARTLAVWCDGRFEDNMTYALKDTPCGDVVGKTVCCFPAGVCRFFPRDQVLQDLEAESYVGVTLWNHTGQPIGLIAVIRRRPLVNRELAEKTLKMVAVRAAAELERLDAEATLRESEEVHRALVCGLPDLIMRFDRQGRHLFVSDNVSVWAGREASSFIGQTHRELGFPETLCCFWEDSIRNVFASGESLETELTMETPAGPSIYNWRLMPERNEQGEVQSVLSISRDITAHRLAEQNYRTLFNEMLDGFALHEIICDEKGRPVDYRYLAANPSFERMTGMKAENLIGRTVREILPGTEQYWIDTYGKVALTGKPVFFENYAGELDKYFSVTAFRPAPNQFACIFSDITERKRIAQALNQSEEKFRKAFNTSPDAINFNRLEDGMYSSINPGFTRLLSYTEEDVIGKTSVELNIWNNPEDRQKLLAGLEKDGFVSNLEAAFRTKNGDINYGLMSASIVELNNVPYILSITRDITGRKHAEVNLRESEEKHRRLFETMAQGVVYQAADGQIISANPAAQQILGLSLDELLGKTSQDPGWQTIREDGTDLPGDEHPAMVALRTGQPVEHFVLGLTNARENTRTWISVTAIPLFQPGETKPFQVYATLDDITGRKQAEENIRMSEKKFRETIKYLDEGYYSASIDGVLLDHNQAFSRIIGYDIDSDLKGQTTPDFWQSHDERKQYIDELFAQGFVRNFPANAQKISGEKIFVLLNAHLVKNEKDDLMRIEGTVIDISERRLSEEALRKKDILLANLASQVPGMLYQFVRKPDGTYTVPYSSQGIKDLYDLAPEEVQDNFEPILNRIFPEDRDKITQTIAESARSLSPWLCEYRVQVPGQPAKWIMGNSIPEKMADGSIVWSGYLMDITERRRAEEEKIKLEGQLQQAQKMESIGRLAGGVAHDFNNMLGVILGNTELSMEQVQPASPLYAELSEIHKAAERSADLTRQLLAFARQQTITPQVLDLNQTMEGSLKMLQRLIGEDIGLLWLPGSGLWPIKMDPSQIDQILVNLCVNARDAIADVGKITIGTENKHVDADFCRMDAGFTEGDYVLLSVSDNGCGMNEEILDKLFEPFFTTKEIGKGTGLGLATVFGIIKQNNGFINVISKVDQGTTFHIYLPRHVGKTEQLQSAAQTAPAIAGHETILLAEDDPAILKMTTMMLEQQGYRVLAANSPGEAIRLAQEYAGQIHLLITDVVMPEMNGRDLAKNLLSLYPHLKRLFMSGYTADIIAHRGVLDPGVYFIQKPFRKKDLAAKVRDALDSE